MAGNTVFAPKGANMNPMPWQTYLPVLTGQTDNPVATYTTQIGRFRIVGDTCLFRFSLVTTTMTKTTTTDLVSVSLPIAAFTLTGDVQSFTARIENGTAVANALRGEIASGASTAQFRNYVLATASAQMTWATTNPGIGVLTNTVTYYGEGSYEIATQ